MKKSIIITIGNELTSGHTVNSNAAYIARFLAKLGIINQKIVAIEDKKEKIVDDLDEAINYDYVFVTGGLGPTHDDITKQVVAEYFDTELKESSRLKKELETFLKERDVALSKVNYEQALFPDKAKIVPNDIGTAAGMHFHEKNTDYYFMPGVPAEMERMLEKYIALDLEGNGAQAMNHYKKVRTFGIPESELYTGLASWITENNNVKVAFLPRMPGVDIVLESQQKKSINRTLEYIKSNFADFIFGYNDDQPYQIVGEKLDEQNLTIAVAESCTGGLIGHALTNRSGSSQYFQGGVIAYSNKVKIEMLGVNTDTIKKNGAVSRETALEMAAGVRKRFNVDIGLSTTGIAGPTGGSQEKPVGTVWAGFATRNKQSALHYIFNKNRIQNKQAFKKFALINTIKFLDGRLS
ncbi:MAG TPA: CinA family nicotinamide mononucleotide deamidase-related protein [bacterium]|nr:CinA family nicotinamide mononucleotide deamidase-related protein [bacterium]